MTRIVHVGLDDLDDSLIVLSARRRAYAGLSRDAAYVHVVHPASVDLVDGNGAVIRREGELTCTCKGARFRGECYRVHQALAWEAQQAGDPAHMVEEHHLGYDSPEDADLAKWANAAPGEIMEAFGK